ncbi:hypothetical protein [Curtobacterium sp. RRHDQ10]
MNDVTIAVPDAGVAPVLVFSCPYCGVLASTLQSLPSCTPSSFAIVSILS